MGREFCLAVIRIIYQEASIGQVYFGNSGKLNFAAAVFAVSSFTGWFSTCTGYNVKSPSFVFGHT